MLHKDLMEELYSNPKFPDAVDLWASFFAKDERDVKYSDWRHLNKKRQEIENRVWRRFITRGDKILDIGCGKGFFLNRVFNNFGTALDYYGIDISLKIIEHAKKYFDTPKYYVGSAEHLPFKSNSFDFVQIISTLEHVESPYEIIHQAYTKLKKGGYLYIVLHKGKKKVGGSKYSFPIGYVRKETSRAINELSLTFMERGDLISFVRIGLYRKLHIPTSVMMFMAKLKNSLPFSSFKNLEYWVYRK